MPRERDSKIKKCTNNGLSLRVCSILVDEIHDLDQEQDRIWSCHDELKKNQSLYDKLNKAYNLVGDARDWLRDIIGDVD